ncbi:MAG: hypothetical protein ACYC60_20525, partial [Thermoanaerobaculia bacterium]
LAERGPGKDEDSSGQRERRDNAAPGCGRGTSIRAVHEKPSFPRTDRAAIDLNSSPDYSR